MEAGVDKLDEAEKVPLDAKGNNVVRKKNLGAPTINKDGVRVTKKGKLDNRVEVVGGQMWSSEDGTVVF